MATLEASLKLKDQFSATLKKIDNSLQNAAKNMQDFKQKASGPAMAMRAFATKAQAAMSKVNSSIRNGLSTASNVVKSSTERILSIFGNFGNRISSKLKLNGAINKFSSGFNNLKGKVSSAFGGIVSKISSGVSKIKAQLASAKQSFQQFGSEMSAATNKMGLPSIASKVGTALKVGLAAGTAATVGLGNKIYNVGGEFSTQMSRVKSIAGATGSEFNSLKKQAMDLGASTAFNATESAAGMENLASAGFNANEIMSAMPGLLDLAAVSGGDIALASENAASALRGFGLDANQAGHVANVFARAAADTNAEVGDMGEAMKYIAPVANAMGISIEETAAAVGILSDAGVKGSQAGTSLRGALSRLAKPTDAMQDTMSALGLSFYDSNGQMKPLVDQVGMLQNAFKGLTPEQQQHALVTLYGQESLSGMLALVQRGPKELAKLTDSLKNSGGAADAMAREMQNNLPAKMEQVGGAIETAYLRTYQKLEPMLMPLADGLAEWINHAFSEKNINGFFDNLAKYGNVLKNAFNDIKGPVGDALSAIGKSIEKITGKFGSEKSVKGFQGFVDGVANGIKKLANFAEKHSDGIAKLITSLPKIAAAFVGFKMAKGAFNFGSGLLDAAKASGTLLSNLTGIGKSKPTKPSVPTPDKPGGGVPGANPLSGMELLTGFAKKAGNLALVYGTIKLIEAAAEALKQVNEKVPADLSILAPKLLNMGIAIAGMGAFVTIASKLSNKNPKAAMQGLAMIAGISVNLMIAAEAMQQIGDKVPNDIGNFVPKLANMGIAIAGMGVLVGIAGALSNINLVGAAAGLGMIAGISGNLILAAEAMKHINDKVPSDIAGFAPKLGNMAIALSGMGALVTVAGALSTVNPVAAAAGLAAIAVISLDLMLAAEAMKQVNDKVPSNIGDFAPKVGNIAIAIGAMGVLTTAVGALIATGIGAVIAAGGFIAIVGICTEMILVAEAIQQVNDKVPNDVGGVTDKIDNMASVIEHFTAADLGNIFDVFSNMVSALNIGAVVSGINKFVELGDALAKLDNVTVPEGIDTKIKDMQKVVEHMTGGGFWSKLGDLIGSGLDAGTTSNVAKMVDSYIEIGASLEAIQGVGFNLQGVKSTISNIQQVVDHIVGDGGFFGKIKEALSSKLDSGILGSAKKSVTTIIQIGESFSELQTVSFNLEGTKAAINNIQKIIDHIAGDGGFFGKLKEFFSGKLDNGVLNSAKKAVSTIIKLGESFKELQKTAFSIENTTGAIDEIKQVIDHLKAAKLDVWNNAGSVGENVTEVQTAIQNIGKLIEPIKILAKDDFPAETVTTQIETIKKVISALSSAFGKGIGNIEAAEGGIEKAKTALTQIEAVKTAINKVSGGELQVGNAVLQINAIKTVVDALKPIVKSSEGIADEGLGKVASSLSKLPAIRNSINAFASGELQSGNAIVKINAINTVINALKPIVTASASITSEGLSQVITALNKLPAIRDAINNFAGGELQTGNAVVKINAIQTVVSALNTLTAGAMMSMAIGSVGLDGILISLAKLGAIRDAINSFAAGAVNVAGITDTIAKIREVMAALNGLSGDGGGAGIATISASIQALSVSLMMLGASASAVSFQVMALNASLITIVSTLSTINSAFQASATVMTTTMTMAMMQVRVAVVTGMAMLVSSFAAGMAQAYATVSAGAAMIVSAFAGLRGQLFSAGMFAMSGLAAGIQAGAGSAIAAAQSVADRVSATVRKALDIHSPSRVFMEIGGFVSAGLANGIQKAQSLVQRASDTLAMATIPNQLATMSVAGNVTSAVNVDDSDISKIQASANQQVVVKHKQVVPQVTIHVVNNGGEPIDEEALLEQFENKIIELIDSDLG